MPPIESIGHITERGPNGERAGYSGSPQRRKLGLHSRATCLIWNRPAGWEFAEPAEPKDDLEHVTLPDAKTPIDIILAFAMERADVAAIGTDLAPLVFPSGNLWIAWPRKAAGHRSEVTEHLLRDLLLPLGIVDTKVAAIDHDWSGLRFVWRKELRNDVSAAQASASYGGIGRC